MSSSASASLPARPAAGVGLQSGCLKHVAGFRIFHASGGRSATVSSAPLILISSGYLPAAECPPCTPRASPGETAVGQASDLLGAGTWRAGQVPLTFAPPEQHCMRLTLAGCARGGGRGQPEFADRSVTSSTELHTPPAAEAAPPLQCPGQKGPQRPVHPAGRGPDQGSAPVRQDSQGKRAIRQSPSGLPPTAAFTDRQVLSVQPLTDPPKLFPFVLLRK